MALPLNRLHMLLVAAFLRNTSAHDSHFWDRAGNHHFSSPVTKNMSAKNVESNLLLVICCQAGSLSLCISICLSPSPSFSFSLFIS